MLNKIKYCTHICVQRVKELILLHKPIELRSQQSKVGANTMTTDINDTPKVSDLIGMTIVGYRYGEAPESGHSWNYADNCEEPGVSMAQVGYYREYFSFAISDYSTRRKRFYYLGQIAGEGGDDELCLTNLKRISYQEYLRLRKETKEVSNKYVNALCDRWLSLLRRGWQIYKTEEQIEETRRKYIRK